MRKVFGSVLLAVIFLAINTSSVSATTQPSSVTNLIAVSPDTWTSADTRASFTVPNSSSRPAASFIDDEALAEPPIIAEDITVAPGRLEMPDSKSISITADQMPMTQMPMTMVMTPYRPMALEGPLAIPEPGSVLLFGSGMLLLPFLLRRKRVA
jgi:hypothetical protein